MRLAEVEVNLRTFEINQNELAEVEMNQNELTEVEVNLRKCEIHFNFRKVDFSLRQPRSNFRKSLQLP